MGRILKDYKVVLVWFTMTSNNCTTDVVVSIMQLVKNKIQLCENIQKYQEGKKTNPNSASIQRICILGLFFFFT